MSSTTGQDIPVTGKSIDHHASTISISAESSPSRPEQASKTSRRPPLGRMKSALRERETPVFELVVYLASYKALLLSIAYISSVIGLYDSSSSILDQPSVLSHWDSVYFAHVATDGYVYEQEFAFGPLMPFLTRYLHPIVVGSVCHGIAVLSFYKATLIASNSERVAKLSAILHIISPAGIFLCVGYTEPVFAALSFTALSILHKHHLLSAILFGLSGMTRATGILFSLYFLPRKPDAWRLIRAAFYASVVCLPWAMTQAYAYYLYCPDRPWCGKMPPLIYSFVQEHYWNVGFGRYFTWSNLPLFIISAPTYILCFISLDFTIGSVIQGLLTFMTFTSAHAQIITRMSSSFPRIYWHLAKMLIQDNKDGRWDYVVIFFVMYGMIQAVLFGAFLPPA